MRQLSPRPARGLTLVELMVTVAIAGILMVAGLPAMSDYIQNSRLREGGNSALAAALYAQSEAVKRNGSVRLAISGSTVQVIDRVDVAPGDDGTVLRTTTLADGVRASDTATIDFGSGGLPTPLGTSRTFSFLRDGSTCSSTIRCPSLLVEAGGVVRLCPSSSTC